jgi:dihydrofolate synthase / folylpolyglutamate synthase
MEVADMPKSLSLDVQTRVLAAISSSLSCRQAAIRFGVSASKSLARERRRADAKRFVFPYHVAMVANRELLETMARLDALTDWERRPRAKMRVGLEPMADLAARLGDPQKSFRAIHVAGTKGKGSVSALIEAALVRAGFRVGRYASPHVERVTERVSVQGREIDEPSLTRALDRALDAYEAARKAGTAGANATWFDLLTAAAFIIFSEARLEWAVVEVGLGGRLDSTNIVDGEIAIVTNIDLEHTEILGNTRAAIAREKVGILKPGAVLVTTLAPDDEAGGVLKARADELGSPVVRVRLDAAATIDETNLALAGAALRQLGRRGVRAGSAAFSDPAVGAWLLDAETRAAARLPGRMEQFEVQAGAWRLPVVLDGAHVPFNLKAVLHDLALAPDLSRPCVAIVALAADKDAKGFVMELGKRASTIVFTDLPGSSRGRSPAELGALAASLGLSSEVEPDPKRALTRGLKLAVQENAWLIVTGSLYLVGALRGGLGETAKSLSQVEREDGFGGGPGRTVRLAGPDRTE